MGSFFDHDSGFMQLVSRFASLVVLNFLFLCTSIPLFTVGASLSALYDVVFRLDTSREGKVVPAYFRAFRSNFRQSTVVWLFFVVLIAASAVNAVIFSRMTDTFGYLLFLICMLILINALLVMGYAFPLISQFTNSTGNTLKNALLLSIAKLPRTLLMALINAFPWILLIFNLYSFVWLGFLWFSLYFAAAAYFNSRVLIPVFRPMMGEDAKY